jgi:hypothetical protein
VRDCSGQKKVGTVFSLSKTALKAKGFITLIDGDLKEMGHLYLTLIN